MAKYRKKPIVIEAFQLTNRTRASNENWPQWLHEAWQERRDTVGAVFPYVTGSGVGPLGIFTLEGTHKCEIGDWIIQGVNKELYPCKADIFEKTYEAVES